jgi:anti-sigma factor RsiW
MNINRHNYEEYFILYMDNELHSDERRMVEAFIQQHPDLKEELDLLLQYKLVPDTTITFSDKEELMKVNGDTPVTLTNYEEWLVLYMDNELSAEQKATVEKFIADNPTVKEDLVLLQRTQLQPEEIIFADKASLYRKEEKVRPLPVRWWRLTAAAVLLLGVGITTAILVNKKSPEGNTEIVKGTSPEKKTTPVTPVILPNTPDNTVNEDAVADNNEVAAPVLKQAGINNAIAKEKNNTVKNPLPTIVTTNPVKEEPEVAKTNKPTNDLPVPLNNPNINKNDATNEAIASNNTPKENKQPNPLTNPVVTTQNPSSSDIVYASNNTDADFDQPDSKKNKNRGFFRKLARTFEKRTDIDPTDDNKLLIAGLSIKLK